MFTDPEVQDVVAREMIQVAHLQKQVLILQRSNSSLKQSKPATHQALLKKLDQKQLEIEMLKEQLAERKKEIQLF